MKKILLTILLLFLAAPSFIFAAEIEDPIVDINQTKEFGLWKIYNSGTTITIVDRFKGGFIRMDATGNNPQYYEVIEQETGKQGYLFHDNGTAGTLSILSSDHRYQQDANEAIATDISAHLQEDVIYGFGKKRFRIQDDTLIIYDDGHFDETAGRASSQLSLKKFTNGVLHEGTDTSTQFEPTTIVDANDIPGPARIVGDCAATYSPEEQKLTIPCLNFPGNNTLYEIDFNQIPGTINFSPDLNTLNAVQ